MTDAAIATFFIADFPLPDYVVTSAESVYKFDRNYITQCKGFSWKDKLFKKLHKYLRKICEISGDGGVQSGFPAAQIARLCG